MVGLFLNDIANALGLDARYTIDYTKVLPKEKGYESLGFDDLPNYFDAVGNENRGYLLKAQKISVNRKLSEVEEIEGFDGAVIYNCNPTEQFSPFTAKSPLAKRGSGTFGFSAVCNSNQIKRWREDHLLHRWCHI